MKAVAAALAAAAVLAACGSGQEPDTTVAKAAATTITTLPAVLLQERRLIYNDADPSTISIQLNLDACTASAPVKIDVRDWAITFEDGVDAEVRVILYRLETKSIEELMTDLILIGAGECELFSVHFEVTPATTLRGGSFTVRHGPTGDMWDAAEFDPPG